MRSENLTIEEKVERLYEHIESLRRRVADLEGRKAAATAGKSTDASVARPETIVPTALPPRPGKPPAKPAAGEPDSFSEEMIQWASRASLFPRMATLCFLMVIALILRTITDNGIVNPLLGMGLGMGYAAALMVAGWYQYRRDSSLAPVFVACGAILMASIVVETHTRFQSLPLVPAYWTLMATGAGTAFISRQFKAFLPVSVGTLGMCLAGAAIDYPNPFFPYLFMILLTANFLGYYAGTLKRCGWLRWTVLFITLAMVYLWGLRLEAVAARKITAAPTLAPGWFVPVLTAVSIAFLAIALLGIVRSREQVSVFDFCLPTINAVGSYLAARVVVSEADGSALALSLVAILFALLHFGAAFWLARRKIEGVPGTNSFVVAGSVLLVLGLPAALGGVLAAPVLGAAALGLAVLSDRWGSGAIRATSYLLQVYAVVSLAPYFLANGLAAAPLAGTVPATVLAAAALGHYRWCRRHAPPARSPLFGNYDNQDVSGVVTLLVALTGFFFLLRGIAWHILAGRAGGADAFQCSQSIIINLAALGLGLYAFRARNREIRNVAILVIAVGALKSTADLLGTKGLPLVFSVLSFGLAAATQSVTLSRWHKASPTPAAESRDPDKEKISAVSE
ncbi:MAG: DUF2339 domain-containing protein [Deltaproteobacteria bacterium]|nr:DUF2339 domain-containing protein [Deltaproteobacteria bacterium]MDH3382602.1 DUF2339 domain-containing protein [Deltaproteobacteria bacterium]